MPHSHAERVAAREAVDAARDRQHLAGDQLRHRLHLGGAGRGQRAQGRVIDGRDQGAARAARRQRLATGVERTLYRGDGFVFSNVLGRVPGGSDAGMGSLIA